MNYDETRWLAEMLLPVLGSRWVGGLGGLAFKRALVKGLLEEVPKLKPRFVKKAVDLLVKQKGENLKDWMAVPHDNDSDYYSGEDSEEDEPVSKKKKKPIVKKASKKPKEESSDFEQLADSEDSDIDDDSEPTPSPDEMKNFKRLEAVIRRLERTPQPPQRTPEWYAQRKGMVTASDGATALGENPYEDLFRFIFKKCGLDDQFSDSVHTHHGKKYEDVATMVYEGRYNTKVKLFGLLGHPSGKKIGASPDAICSEKKLDGKGYCRLVGRMVEIKCPITRKIKFEGKVDGDICPHYYWVQVQLQLQCCSLDDCDFWQVKLNEMTREEYLAEVDMKTGRSKKTGLEMGCIIQLMDPEERKKQYPCVFGAKYIYPERCDMNPAALEKWEKSELARVAAAGPDGIEIDDGRYEYDRTLYWKVETALCTLIPRDDKWFEEKYPKIERTWAYVEWFREHPKQLDLWYRYSKTQKILTNKMMMEIADKLIGDNQRGSYFKDLEKQVAASKNCFEKKRFQMKAVFNNDDLESLLQSDSD
jgi:putative phage-type endonuclease